ncbi:MAG TPA: preprotein translocase subunit SecE [Solirubrobacter sp.]|nr:preprotein translocase subunit SecE [Solirubrobacter sp.]
MATDRPRPGESDAEFGADDVRDDELAEDRVRADEYERDFGQAEPPDPLGQAEPYVTEAHLGEHVEPEQEPEPEDDDEPGRPRRRSRAERAARAEASAAAGRAGNELQVSAAANGEAKAPEEHHHASEPAHPRKGLFGRAIDFLKASYAELRRVQWPDRRQVGQGTAVTIGFVVVAGAWLGLLDAIWNPIIQAIL